MARPSTGAGHAPVAGLATAVAVGRRLPAVRAPGDARAVAVAPRELSIGLQRRGYRLAVLGVHEGLAAPRERVAPRAASGRHVDVSLPRELERLDDAAGIVAVEALEPLADQRVERRGRGGGEGGGHRREGLQHGGVGLGHHRGRHHPRDRNTHWHLCGLRRCHRGDRRLLRAAAACDSERRTAVVAALHEVQPAAVEAQVLLGLRDHYIGRRALLVAQLAAQLRAPGDRRLLRAAAACDSERRTAVVAALHEVQPAAVEAQVLLGLRDHYIGRRALLVAQLAAQLRAAMNEAHLPSGSPPPAQFSKQKLPLHRSCDRRSV